jgi:hypothetical protein
MSITDICQERLQAQLTNKPPPRNELQPSPYELGFTKFQLDMRRKAEILEYSAVKQNTKTNNPTRSQKWSNFVNNRSRVSQSLINDIANNTQPVQQACPDDRLIPKPTYASNVPGPIIDLVYDPNVPLYNYQNNTQALGVSENETV